MGDATVHALRAVSFTIGRADLVAIMGPSGSGKSTLMHIMGCLDRPDAGQAVLEDTDITRVSDNVLAEIRNKRIGFVFQQFNLLPQLTALENVEVPLAYGGVPRRERRRAAIEALEAVGLADRHQHRPNQLSGGQRQRAAIARAIINRPSLILADEPTGALDSQSGRQIMELFRELNAAGHTVVVVTHEAEVAAMTRRIMHIRDGAIVELEEVGA